ncbi:hypothetical protein MNBD_ACTINO02-839 [hydrothermal vent metagenome]|uniref:BFN domain-containing protein n=1 Tax=hydrothermal vent metagenome TaxID=652676 RepID=A0A3B0SGW1_9ZZZZ
MSTYLPVEIVGIRIELPTNTPVMLLREQGGKRHLPIWIGPNEATAIALALEGIEPQRPMTHDLFSEVIQKLSFNLKEVVVTGLESGTYFAELHFEKVGESPIIVSARPSDAIALATRLGAAVTVAEDVLDEAGILIQNESDTEDADKEIERFREFLDDIDPDDFGEGHQHPSSNL